MRECTASGFNKFYCTCTCIFFLKWKIRNIQNLMHKEFKEFYIMTFVQYLCPTDTRASKRADNIFGHQKLWYNMKQQVFPCTCAGAIKVFWEMTCFQSKNWFVSLSQKWQTVVHWGLLYCFSVLNRVCWSFYFSFCNGKSMFLNISSWKGWSVAM